MSKRKILASGLALGIILTMSFQVFAAPAIENIQAYINNEMTFKINDKVAALPDDYEVIVYKDRSYVPVRFIAENLNAEVDWDNTTKVISISSTQSAVIPPVKPEEPSDDQDKNDYKELPLFKENTELKMSVKMYSEDSYGKKLTIELENKTDIPVQLDQLNSVIECDGVKYDMKDATIANLDTRWYKDIHKEDKIEGYVRLPNNLKEPKKLHLEFKIISNDSHNKLKNDTIIFDIDLTNEK